MVNIFTFKAVIVNSQSDGIMFVLVISMHSRDLFTMFWYLIHLWCYTYQSITLLLLRHFDPLTLLSHYKQWSLILLSNYLHIHYSQCYFVHRYLNNAWLNKAHSVIGKPYLTIIASDDSKLWLKLYGAPENRV